MINYSDKEIELIDKCVIDNIAFGEIKQSDIHGCGLFAKEKIIKESILCILDGQIMNWSEYEVMTNLLRDELDDIKNFLFMEWNALSTEVLLIRTIRTKYSYINHSRKPNLEIRYFPIRIVATRDISIGVELLLDYRNEPLREEYISGQGKSYL